MRGEQRDETIENKCDEKFETRNSANNCLKKCVFLFTTLDT